MLSELKTFTKKRGVKFSRKRNCFWENFTLLKRIFWHRCFSLRSMIFLPPLPKSNVQTFQIFRILGEKLWKEVVSDLKTFAHKGCNIAAARNFFTIFFFFFCSLHLNVFLPPLPKVQCPNFLDFWNSLAKVLKRSGLRL